MKRATDLVMALEQTPESVWTREACLCVGDALREAARQMLDMKKKFEAMEPVRKVLPEGIVFIGVKKEVL